MKHPITASIILVQLDEDDSVTAYVAYEMGPEKDQRVRLELRLGTMEDATDMQMWMQMVSASVCDAL